MYNDVRARYCCHYKVRHPKQCDGQSGYGVRKLDKIVDEIVRQQFSQICLASSNDIIAQQHERAVERARSRHKIVCAQLAEKQKELSDYQGEVLRVIRGESRLDADLLGELMEKAKAEIQELSSTLAQAKQELDEKLESAAAEQKEFDQLRSWADLYDRCTFAAKKMIVSQFVKAVYVRRDYDIEIEFNVSFEEFRALTITGNTV